MSTLTLEATPGLAGDRSVPAEAGARRQAASPGVGRPADPEVVAVAKRRKHSNEYKLRILSEIDANPGRTGAILRREGLYSSNLSKWRLWKDEMSTQQKATPASKHTHNELAKLKRENARLKMQLQRAEGLIDLQKKASELLSMMSRNENEESG